MEKFKRKLSVFFTDPTIKRIWEYKVIKVIKQTFVNLGSKLVIIDLYLIENLVKEFFYKKIKMINNVKTQGRERGQYQPL